MKQEQPRVVEKICKNCVHFAQRSIGISKDTWGDCLRNSDSPTTYIDDQNGSFTWTDSTCDSFEPRQEAD